MDERDKATLRLACGLGLAVLVAYGLALPMPFVVCVMAVVVLCKPGPPIPLLKGAVIALVFAALVAVGVVMVPLLENYALTGLLLTAVVLYGVFFLGLRRANPLTMVLVISFALIPVAGVADQALVGMLSVTLAVGILTGTLVSALSRAFFPDRPGASGKKAGPRSLDREAAGWIALRATLIVMPVFVLALTNPSLYLAAVMKTVTLGQQAGETDARSAGGELVGSTLMGAAHRRARLVRPVAAAQSLDADAVDDGGRAVDRIRHVRCAAHGIPALVLEQCADHRADPARSGDRGQRERQGRIRGLRRTHRPVRRRVALCLGDGLDARALARREVGGCIARTDGAVFGP